MLWNLTSEGQQIPDFSPCVKFCTSLVISTSKLKGKNFFSLYSIHNILRSKQSVFSARYLLISFLALRRTLEAPVQQCALEEWSNSFQPPHHTSPDPSFGTSQVPLIWNRSYHKLMHRSFAETLSGWTPVSGLMQAFVCVWACTCLSGADKPHGWHDHWDMPWHSREVSAASTRVSSNLVQASKLSQSGSKEAAKESSLDASFRLIPPKLLRYSWSILLFGIARYNRNKPDKWRDLVTLPCRCSIPSISLEHLALASEEENEQKEGLWPLYPFSDQVRCRKPIWINIMA